jgi:DNA-binding MarR family transcriptional regulator
MTMTFQNCICFQLGVLSRKITRHYRDKIANYNLTHAQFFMLMAVIELEGAQPSQLSDMIFVDRATTTGLIDRLERDGWVERRPDTEDRRTLRVYLSSKAKKHKNEFVAIFNEINGSFINRFTDKEWKQFQFLLGKLES